LSDAGLRSRNISRSNSAKTANIPANARPPEFETRQTHTVSWSERI
jgi:hypothetical protein